MIGPSRTRPDNSIINLSIENNTAMRPLGSFIASSTASPYPAVVDGSSEHEFSGGTPRRFRKCRWWSVLSIWLRGCNRSLLKALGSSATSCSSVEGAALSLAERTIGFGSREEERDRGQQYTVMAVIP